jgi:hypothetical protein
VSKLSPAERRTLKEALGAVGVVGVLGAAVLASTVSAKPDDASSSCVELLDRYVELRARAGDASTGPQALEQARREALERAEKSGALARCSARLTRSAAECAAAASNDNQFEQCFP